MEALLYEEQNSFTLEKNSTLYGNEQTMIIDTDDWKNGCKREMDFDLSYLLRSPDITTPTSELEKFFNQGNDSGSKLITPEDIPGEYHSSPATEEQEMFVRGFTDALQKLYHEEKRSCMPLDTNSNVASLSKPREENSKYTFVNYCFDSSEKLPPFSELFLKLRERSSNEVQGADSSHTCLNFEEVQVVRTNNGETEKLNWNLSSPKTTTTGQDNSFRQVVKGDENKRNEESTLILRISEQISCDQLSSKNLGSLSFNQDEKVFEEDPISLSLENARLKLDSIEVDLETKKETDKNAIGQTEVYMFESSCKTDGIQQTENILESLSSFYESNSDCSISSPSTSEYSNNEMQHLFDEHETSDEFRDKNTHPSNGDFATHEFFNLDTDFGESLAEGLSPLHDEIPTNKHWLSLHTKLYNMGAHSQQNETGQHILECGNPNRLAQPMDHCSVQEFVKTQRKRRKNRLAAWKCRQKKLIRQSCLESKVEELCHENAKLLEELEVLKKKRRALEESFVQHASSGCQEAQEQYHQRAFNPISI